MLLYASCGLFRKAIELLLLMDRPATAALFMNACVETGACTMGSDFDDSRSKNVFSASFATKVFTAYAHHLQEIGFDIPSSLLHNKGITIDAML